MRRSRTAGHHVGVAIVGAGQAGLAVGYYLARSGVDFLLLERTDQIGTSWARRWDSLRLFTPARHDALPGLAFPGEPWAYPGKGDVAAYLAEYATHHRLPVRTGAHVVRLAGQSGAFNLQLASGEAITARRVVVATGAFGAPFTPAWADRLDPDVVQVHTDAYRNPGQVPTGTVLVVGGGNSGFQVSHELAQAGRRVHLSEGTRLRTLPQQILGRDLFWWLTTTRAIHAPAGSLVGRRLRANEPVIGSSRRALHRAGVTFHSRATTAEGNRVDFADGATLQVDAVVWATGYRHDDNWVTIPGALDKNGALCTDDGTTPVPGLHTIGRPWQRDRGSSLLGYVARDASRLAARLGNATQTGPVTEPEVPAPEHRRHAGGESS